MTESALADVLAGIPFAGVRDSALHGLSRRLHAGRSFIVVQTDLTDDAGKLVGQTTQTQAVLAPAPAETGGDQGLRPTQP